jgi:tRNA pseudouridine55 synthase
MDGFLNLNKPLGLTSHDCVMKVKRSLKTKKVGHAGTLDPAASGVLPIAVGRATRLLQYLSPGKAYLATVRFGITTDSDDLEGKILTQTPVPQLTQAAVLQALPQFQGRIQQVPPSYSAIQMDGKRLYDLARSGQAVTAPTREVEIHQIEVVAWRDGAYPEIDLAIDCGAGTYIRSIARDLGVAVGTGATLSSLCRTVSSSFQLADSLTLETLAEQGESLALIHPIDVLGHLERIVLPDDLVHRWCCGQKNFIETLPLDNPQIAQAYVVFNEQQEFLGITEVATVTVTEAEKETGMKDGWRLLPQMVYQPAN